MFSWSLRIHEVLKHPDSPEELRLGGRTVERGSDYHVDDKVIFGMNLLNTGKRLELSSC